MARTRVRNFETDFEEREATNLMSEVMLKVYSISRGIPGVPPSDPRAGLRNARDVEKEINAYLADGWKLMGQPQYNGREAYMVTPDAALLYSCWFIREQ